jgi:DnaJ-class molecular chaperone
MAIIGINLATSNSAISVPTLGGPVALKVPPGTQPDAQSRLRGKGLPRFGARGHGDLYVQVSVRVPEQLGAEERKLWERLHALRAQR